MYKKMVVVFAVSLFLMGCAGTQKNSLDFNVPPAEVLRDMSQDILDTWPIISGVLKEYVLSQADNMLPKDLARILYAITLLDAIKLQKIKTDEDRGRVLVFHKTVALFIIVELLPKIGLNIWDLLPALVGG